MRLVIDMNLSPAWVEVFADSGITAKHWSTIGSANATDMEIMKWACAFDHVGFTHDLDFGALLHLTAVRKPSVIQIRAEDVRPSTMGAHVCAAIQKTLEDLRLGALVTIDPRRNRVTLLPLRRGS